MSVVGTILLLVGIVGGIYIYSIDESIFSVLSFTPIYIIGAVAFHAFAELLDSVNAIRYKLLGTSLEEVNAKKEKEFMDYHNNKENNNP
ncbi:hypothetical protein NV377_06325 [Paenibacillus sp. T3-5-0-4]|nr:hypothetical protein [Paenibacillus endoradicis]